MMQEVGVTTNPYPGLRPFEPHENHLFFGRDGQNNELLRRLRRRRFLAVVGPSGSGKSSLVRAGLLPDLHSGMMAGRGSHWQIALFRPGGNPIGNLAAALYRPGVLIDETEEDEDRSMELAFTTITLQRSALGIVEAVRQAGLPERNNVLIVVDQFEELFRFKEAASVENASDQATAFVKLLLTAADQKEVPVFVIITMRSDFLGDCAQFRDLPEAINEGQYLVPRMTRAERREAIAGPAAVGGAALTPRLVQRLLNDVGDNPDQLPILQHALMRTWDHWLARRRDGEPIDLPDYEDIGGMETALSLHADEAYAELGEGPQQQIAERLFKFVTEKGPDNRETRRPARLGDLAEAVDATEEEVIAVIDVFRKPGRSFLMPPARETLTAESLIDISHESLIRQWDTLLAWVDEEAESARVYRRLAERAVLYRAGKESYLTDPQLQLALDWREHDKPSAAWAWRYDPDPDASPRFDVAMAYLNESEAQRTLAARRERRRFLLMGALAWIALGAALVAGYFAITASSALDLAQEQRQQAIMSDTEAQVAKRQAIAAARGDSASRVEAEDQRQLALALRDLAETQRQIAQDSAQAAQQQRQLALALRDSAETQRQIAQDSALAAQQQRKLAQQQAFLADSRRLASQAENLLDQQLERALLLSMEAYRKANTFETRNLLLEVLQHDSKMEFTFRGHQASVTSVALSPDGMRLASGSIDSTVILWDVETRQRLGEPLRGHQAEVYSVAFSPDGTRLVSGSVDDTIILWDVATQEPLGKTLRGHKAPVKTVVFSPDGTRLASGSVDDTIILWDVATQEPLGKPLRGHKADVLSVAFNHDGTRLASGSFDNTIIFWDVARQKALGKPLRNHDSDVFTVAFSPDGTRLASGSTDRTVILWDTETREPLGEPLLGHQADVLSVAFSPDGTLLASGSDDNTVILWDVETRQALGEPLQGHRANVKSVVFSPDGTHLASGSDDDTIILWDVATQEPLSEPLRGHHANVKSVVFSPDGTRLASCSYDSTIILWDAETRQPLGEPLRGHHANVLSAAFSPDGTRLASSSSDRTVILWDVATQKPLGEPLRGHHANVWSVAFSPDGTRLASGSADDTVILWDAETHQRLSEPLRGHESDVYSVAFSPDGTRLASGSADDTIILWDVETRQALGEPLRGHQDDVLSVAFSPDGSRLASGSRDGTVILWDVDLTSWQARACQRAGRNLTQEEWDRYIGANIPYRRTCPDLPPSE